MPSPAPTVRGYQYLTLTQATSQLANRLGDPGQVFWVYAELVLYIQEAMRTWQAYTAFFKEKGSVNLTSANLFYDLTTAVTPAVTPSYPLSLFGYNVTDRTLVSQICYHLIESQLTGGFTWGGTEQFNLGAVMVSLQNRINRFLGDSGCVLSYYLQSSGLAPTGNGIALLPDSTLDIRRCAWIDADGNYTALWREDEFSIGSYLPNWQTNPTDPPQVYSPYLTPPISVQVAPSPVNPGNIECLLIKAGPTVSTTTIAAGATLLGMPDDFTWGVKWGVLADLLNQSGEGTDIARAAYCESRYQEAVQLARAYPSVLQAQVNGDGVDTGSVFDSDVYNPLWQNQTPSQPSFIGFAGRNLLAVSPVDQNYQITLDMVRNAPVPQLTTDFLQVPRDVVDVILDYAQHIASFKLGGGEFSDTTIFRNNLLFSAVEYNSKLRQMAFYNDALRAPGLSLQDYVPRNDVPDLSAYGNGGIGAGVVSGGDQSSG